MRLLVPLFYYVEGVVAYRFISKTLYSHNTSLAYGNLEKYWGVTCYGLAYSPEGVAILLVV